MKSVFKMGFVLLVTVCFSSEISRAQSVAQCLEQLSLDYRKLAGLKSILQQMYKGYEVLNKSYNAVKAVSQGNFSLHEAFLDGLMLVSPAVRKYPRIADIINDQAALVGEYKAACTTFRRDPHFDPDETGYMMAVYDHLVSASLKNLDDLTMVVTDSQLRMSDAERLTAIDRIYTDSHSQLSFLRRFNDQAYKTALQRSRDVNDRRTLKKLYGIN
ncbi:TerB family tellurite resistance protein [Mucilaginibacter sp.]|uniref:TerB family tellurite resistance protein n=1 Tax=Mucilaginibacter sp. TaxID=1882438 RepID=UPI002632E1EF|nr:TerB family tellurite resistance protein [Mucilaginibacter sp.]MDB4921845.1 TerB family tellurite resistance protein [Mucilaginibacter sp.]